MFSSTVASERDCRPSVSPQPAQDLRRTDHVSQIVPLTTKPSSDVEQPFSYDVSLGPEATRTEYVHFAPTRSSSPLPSIVNRNLPHPETTVSHYVEPTVYVSESGNASLATSSLMCHEYSYCSAVTASTDATLVSSSVAARTQPEVPPTPTPTTMTTTTTTTTTSGMISAAAAGLLSHPALPVKASGFRRQSHLSSLWRLCCDAFEPSVTPEREELRRLPASGTETPAVGAPIVRPLCVYCSEPFDPATNRRGRCPDAPDRAAQFVDRAACMCCARALVYHCLQAGEEDRRDAGLQPTATGGRLRHQNSEAAAVDEPPHTVASPFAVDPASAAAAGDDVDGDPCACNGVLTPAARCKRWTVLAALSLVVPCLWCYWPMLTCHRCAVRTGWCGGRHRSAVGTATRSATTADSSAAS
jgi:hypothetical protein